MKCPECNSTTIARISSDVWGEPLLDEYGDFKTVDRCLVCGYEVKVT
jgi:hypothetical protein